MTRPTGPTTVSSSQRLGTVDRRARLSNGSSAVVCLARLLGRLAAKAYADDHHPKQSKETEHD
jgi:hypothetical protein